MLIHLIIYYTYTLMIIYLSNYFFFRVTCSASKLFEFCWTLFIVAKSEFPDLSENLVNSYHLLLACCDYVYTNILIADLRDLLNKSFGGIFLK